MGRHRQLRSRPDVDSNPIPIAPPIRRACRRRGRERESPGGIRSETARSDRGRSLSVQSQQRRPVLFQISAHLQVMCLQVTESLVDRRWSSGLRGSGTVEC